jgi:hypothetical protein
VAVDRVVGWRRAMCQGDFVPLFPGNQKRTKAGHRSESMAETRATLPIMRFRLYSIFRLCITGTDPPGETLPYE